MKYKSLVWRELEGKGLSIEAKKYFMYGTKVCVFWKDLSKFIQFPIGIALYPEPPKQWQEHHHGGTFPFFSCK